MSRDNNRQLVGIREQIDELSPLLEIVKGFTRAMVLTWERELPKSGKLSLIDLEDESEK